jgi:hypothetical protein
MQKGYDPEFIKSIFYKTRILKKPITGIVSGYHNLPYVLVGPDEESDNRCIEVKGRVDVSPRMIFSPNMTGPTYGEVFEEIDQELMEKQIIGRVFSFVYSKKYNVKLESKDFEIKKRFRGPNQHLDSVMDEFEKGEVINTGVIFSPNIKFYPVSIDKFISNILDREFGVQ